MSGHAELERMIETIRDLPGLGRRAAPDVAEVLEAALERTIAAGTTPAGEPWQPTRDGRAPLTGAAKALGVAAVGSTIYVRLTGPEARHHLGTAAGGITRQVIPAGALPPVMAEAVRVVLNRHFEEMINAGGSGHA
jgi:hypothetical protein